MDIKRLGVLGIVIEHPQESQEAINNIISKYSHIVIGRMGIPYHERKVAVVSLIVDGTEDEINSLTGQLGNVSGVTARALMTKK
ncbi:MAG: TM1266 family iron-only hydrogenase system putative regulator [Spirochaetota bacterium]